MSIHPEFDNPQLAAIGTTPIILRFEGLHPGDLGRFCMHNDRLGGDLSHVDPDATGRNEVLFGADDWKDTLRAEIDTAMRHNLEENVKALKAKSRKKEASARVERGLADPWQRCRHGPLREGILTVNKAWFGGTGHLDWDPEKVAAFRESAVAFLKQSFPDGQLRYAVGHADEEAYHIHFVVAVWRERVTANRGSQILLQASLNPMIASYEHAQNLAGEAFSDLGITRGKRDAEARRAAKRAGEPVPEKRLHVPPSAWRAEQRTQAKAEVKQIKQAAEAMAGVIVGDGLSLAKATVRKSRKRAIKEAKARKQALAREVAAETRRLDAMSAAALQKTAAATAAEVDMRAAQAKITASAEKLITQTEKAQEDVNRLRAERTMEMEKLQATQAERAEQEAARDRAKGDTEEIISETEKASARLQGATADLERAQADAGQVISEAEETFADATLALTGAKQTLAASQQKAETMVDDARNLARAAVRKARKRAIREARARKDQATRAAQAAMGAAARHRDVLLREAAEAVKKEKADAEAILNSIADKTTMATAQLESQDILLHAAQQACASERDRLTRLQQERAEKEAARKEVWNQILDGRRKRDEITVQVNTAKSDLAQVQKTATAAALALEASELKRENEEAKLQTAERAVTVAQTQAENLVTAVEAGLNLIAEGEFCWQTLQLMQAPMGGDEVTDTDREETERLWKRVQPALPWLQRILQVVAKAVHTIFAKERLRLAQDAAFVTGLRNDWDAEQKAKLDALSWGPMSGGPPT